MRLLLLVHPPVRVVAQRPLLLLLGNVVLLLEQVALDLGVLELLEVSVCAGKLVSTNITKTFIRFAFACFFLPLK